MIQLQFVEGLYKTIYCLHSILVDPRCCRSVALSIAVGEHNTHMEKKDCVILNFEWLEFNSLLQKIPGDT